MGKAQEVVRDLNQTGAFVLQTNNAIESPPFSGRLGVLKILSQQLEVKSQRGKVVLDLMNEHASRFGEFRVMT
jgi:hypothetical protein